MNSFVSEDKCEMFSHLKGSNLQELVTLIENYYLTYRNSLNLENDITFGYELEFEKYNRKLLNWQLKRKIKEAEFDIK